jgi:hypothetical protein
LDGVHAGAGGSLGKCLAVRVDQALPGRQLLQAKRHDHLDLDRSARCDTGGVAQCSVGPAWQNGGGVGYGFATFEAHANWFLYTSPYYNSTDVLNLTIPVG